MTMTNKQRSLLTTLAVSCLLLPQLTHATTQASDFTEDDFFADIPTVITATNISQKLTKAPAAVSIITQNMIEASGALNIPDLFRLVPGMQVFHVSSNKMGATYHGMSDDFPSRMEVMINGRSIYIPLLSTVVWEATGITVDDVDYIEVVRGSNVPTHGSNAFLGAINIITKSPVAESGTSIKATTGALGTQNYTARHSENSEQLHYTLSAGSLKNDGIDLFNDAGHSKHLTFYGSMTPSLSDTIHFELGVTEGYAYRGDGDKTDPIEANFSPRIHRSNFQDVRWNRIFDNDSELQLRYSHNYLKLQTENYDEEGLATRNKIYKILQEPPFGLPAALAKIEGDKIANQLITANNGIAPRDNERGTVETHEMGILYKVNPTDEIHAVMGSDFRYERAKSDVLLQNPGNNWIDETSFQLFGNLEYQVTNKTTFNAGTMFEESSIAGGATSFRTALNYAISDLSTIRVAYSHAHRMPSLLEANSSYTVDVSAFNLNPPGTNIDIYTAPNRDMEPEEINSFEIGFFHLWPEYSSQVDIRMFYEDINDAIGSKKLRATDDDKDYNISTNNAEWTNQGIEAQLKFTSPAPHQSSIVFNYGYNHLNGTENAGYYPDTDIVANGDPYPDTIDILTSSRSPLHTASILLSTKPTPNSLIGLSHYYMDHVEWFEGYSAKHLGRTNYTRTDLKLSNKFTLDTRSEFELSLIIQNLFDKEYVEFYANNIFGRRTYLQLGLKF